MGPTSSSVQPQRSPVTVAPGRLGRRGARLVLLLVLLTAIGGSGLVLFQRQQRRVADAAKAKVLLPRRISAIGRVEPLDRVVNLSVPSSLSNDAVRQLLVKEGVQVNKGQPLAILDSYDSLASTAAESEAAVAVAARKLTAQASVITKYRAELAQADVELRRYSQLFASGATSAELRDRRQTIQSTTAANLEQAIADRLTLAAEWKQRQATLMKDRSELAKATIRAPVSGTVFKIHAYPGDKVGDDGILEIGDSSRMGVIAEVYQTDRPGIALGQRVVITADGFPGKSMPGKVVEIARQVSRQTVFSGQAGENLDRRVLEVKIGLDPVAAVTASYVNYMQVNVIFEPLSEQQKQQQKQRQQLITGQQIRGQSQR
ncbi:MAG: efflux RND transporter periplasmic adaptor subunit [Cyanobacteria bacterium]|nr:efflux RND transporter periplasmic adaptor subunit [Cyanobacteriota bacterium]